MGIKRIRDETLQDIANAIKSKTGTTEPIKTNEMANAIGSISAGGDDRYDEGFADGKTEGIEEGKQAEYDRFWDAFQENGERTNYNYVFAGKGWNNDTFKPKYPIRPINGANMFQASNITGDLRDYCVLDTSRATALGSFIYGAQFSAIGAIDLNSTHMGQIAYNAPNLEYVEKIIFHPEIKYIGSSVIANCLKLREIRFEGEYKQHNTTGYNFSDKVPNLSKESIISLINVLSDGASGLTCTLAKSTIDREFATSEDANDGSSSVEWAALVATKPNWTISLV